MSPERRPTIIERAVVGTVQSLVRGYSAEDLSRARRIAGGEITPEDRTRFIREGIEKIYAAFYGVSSAGQPSLFTDSVFPYLSIKALTKPLSEIENLPDEQVDDALKQQALGNLIRWKQPISLQSH